MEIPKFLLICPFLFSRSLLAQSEILRFYNLSTYTDLWGGGSKAEK